jgi:hypothetical protein
MSQSDRIVPAIRKKFWWLALFTIAIYILMRWVSGGLSGSAIVALEMAKTPEKATLLLKSLELRTLILSTYVDFIFLIGYSATLFYGSRWLGHLSGQYILRKAGTIFSMLVLIAGLVDVIENLSLLHTLYNGVEAWVIHITYDMAVTKFSLLLIDILFCGVCLFFWGIEKIQLVKL